MVAVNKVVSKKLKLTIYLQLFKIKFISER